MNYSNTRKENKSIRAKIKNLSKKEDEIESRFTLYDSNKSNL